VIHDIDGEGGLYPYLYVEGMAEGVSFMILWMSAATKK